MLNAFKDQLRALAVDPQDPFADIVRRLAGPRHAPIHLQPLRLLILSTPTMAGQLARWTDDGCMHPTLLRQQKFALAYLYSPVDFLPEGSLGLFGYLDDAYLVGSVYEATRRELDRAGILPDAPDDALRGNAVAGMNSTRKLLPRETSAIDRYLSEVAHGLEINAALRQSAQWGMAAQEHLAARG